MTYNQKGECRNTGRTHFKKGDTSWLNGKKGYTNSGSFKKGHVSYSPPAKIIVNTCLNCENTFERNVERKFCSQRCHYGSRKTLYTGDKSSHWKGGFVPKNRMERTSYAYKKWRKNVLERDGNKCRLCKSEDNLHAHHLIPFAEIDEFRYGTPNGITLCRECHILVHKNEDMNKELMLEAVVLH